MSDLRERWEKADPEGYLRQRIAYLENRIEALAGTLEEVKVNAMALESAKHVEEIFVQSHRSTRHRIARVQLEFKRVIETVLYGEPAYSRYDTHNISEPL